MIRAVLSAAVLAVLLSACAQVQPPPSFAQAAPPPPPPMAAPVYQPAPQLAAPVPPPRYRAYRKHRRHYTVPTMHRPSRLSHSRTTITHDGRSYTVRRARPAH